MHHLCQRMNPGIGTTGTHDAKWCTGNARQGALKRILHGIAIRLRLPAGKTCAIIFESQRNPHGLNADTKTVSSRNPIKILSRK